MSDFTWYDAGTTTIGVNAEEVSQRLGELRRKTPAVIKVAVNATARETRKEMLLDGQVDPERVNALLGTDIPAAEQYRYLARVDIRTADDSCPGGPADVTIPSWRGDVEHFSDIAEEVARFYG